MKKFKTVQQGDYSRTRGKKGDVTPVPRNHDTSGWRLRR
jgi:hypothetical protein